MKKSTAKTSSTSQFNFFILLFIMAFVFACKEFDTPKLQTNPAIESNVVQQQSSVMNEFPQTVDYYLRERLGLQISEYVRRIFQDRNGNIWFGTNNFGIARYDGRAFKYFSISEGLGGTQVTGIIEDVKGDIWVSTNGGVSRFDGSSFTNYTTADGLSDNGVWSILEDRNGTIWVGTLDGVCTFNGKEFVAFSLPETDIENPEVRFSTKLVQTILEDRQGNLWFGTDGVGVFKFDGENFTQISERDGLPDNNIVCILEDAQGDFWFSSRFGGVSRFDGESYHNYTADKIVQGEEVWNLYEDNNGAVWFSSEGYGVYRYDGTGFVNFGKSEGLLNLAVQSMLQDEKGRFWFGTGAGLFEFNGTEFYNVTRRSINGC